MIVQATFPTGVWDGSTPNRSSRSVNNEGDYREIDRIVAEVIAVQTQTVNFTWGNNTAAVALAATSGHAYLPTCSGTPTGVPSARTGYAGVLVDTTGNKLWVYNSGWKSIALT